MTHDVAGPSVASTGSASRWNSPDNKPPRCTGFVFVRWEDAEDQEVCVSVGYWNGKDFCKVISVDDQTSVYGDTFKECGKVTGWMGLVYPSVD
jgi:hypothetical protein